MKYSDEDHPIGAKDIAEYLKLQGIYAERRSIYRDIYAMNLALWMIYNESDDIDEAETAILECEEEKVIVYKKKKGFYVRQRRYEVEDVQLIAECIYSAKFVEAKKSKRLLDIVLDLISEYQGEKIRHSAFLTERTKTDNAKIFYNVMQINSAMSHRLDGLPHIPEKIKFKYLMRSVNNVRQRVERRKGEEYIVSPYELLINDGNYYLLGYSDTEKEMRTYRVDRMKSVSLTGISRDGEEEFKIIDMSTYTKRVFYMYGGRKTPIVLQCKNSILDTVYDRFGSDDVSYSVLNGGHFSVTTTVEVSNQFFGWLLGLGTSVKILQPPELVSEFKDYVDKINKMYK